MSQHDDDTGCLFAASDCYYSGEDSHFAPHRGKQQKFKQHYVESIQSGCKIQDHMHTVQPPSDVIRHYAAQTAEHQRRRLASSASSRRCGDIVIKIAKLSALVTLLFLYNQYIVKSQIDYVSRVYLHVFATV